MSIHEEILAQGYEPKELYPVYRDAPRETYDILEENISTAIQDVQLCSTGDHSFIVMPAKLVPEAFPNTPDPKDEEFRANYVLYFKK